MKEYIELYNQNHAKIETFIADSIQNLPSLNSQEGDSFKKLFRTFPSLELVYVADNASRRQLSSNFYRNKEDALAIDRDRTYLIDMLDVKENGLAFTPPYQSSATNNICITVTKKEGQNIVFMDYDLEILLERLGLIERDKFFSNVTKVFYMIAGFFMMFLALAAIFYAGADFFQNLMASKLSVDTIFKPIIAATLGLAIFDLAKTILEQEVYFKSYIKDSKIEMKTLTKFLVTILIALSIETLMVVFKIAIEDYHAMLSAFYLLAGTSLFMVALSALIYFSKKGKN